MPAILRDQIWQFIGAIFGFVAIIVTIILWRMQRRRKALSYEIISLTSLLSVNDEIKGKLKIYFDDKPIYDVHLVTVKIINSGNVPIVSTDYERPVSLSFGENPQILTAEISETNPDNLQASVGIEATRVVLEPVLLNGGDSITLKLLVGKLGEISVDGRIVGVKDIRKFVATIFWPTLLGIATSFVGFGLLFIIVYSMVLLVMVDFNPLSLPPQWIAILILIAVLGIAVMVGAFIDVIRDLKKRLWDQQPTER